MTQLRNSSGTVSQTLLGSVVAALQRDLLENRRP